MKESRLDIDSYVNELAVTASDQSTSVPPTFIPLESVLKGSAVELWSTSLGELFIVADEDDAKKLGVPRGTIYTAAEVHRIVRISDPAVVREIHDWKRKFDGVVRETRL